MRIAMINDTGEVYNVAAWDGSTPWLPHTPAQIVAGFKLVDISANPLISYGWTYDGNTFTPPSSPDLVVV